MITPTVLLTLLVVSAAGAGPAPVYPAALPSRSFAASVATPLGESAAQQMQALETWIKAYEHWQVWFTRWRNQSEPGSIAARGRLQKPDPPAWLPAACSGVIDETGPMVDGCRAYDTWKRDEYLVASSRR